MINGVEAGNNSPLVRNEIVSILDILLKNRYINAKQHKKLYNKWCYINAKQHKKII